MSVLWSSWTPGQSATIGRVFDCVQLSLTLTVVLVRSCEKPWLSRIREGGVNRRQHSGDEDIDRHEQKRLLINREGEELGCQPVCNCARCAKGKCKSRSRTESKSFNLWNAALFHWFCQVLTISCACCKVTTLKALLSEGCQNNSSSAFIVLARFLFLNNRNALLLFLGFAEFNGATPHEQYN